MAYQKGYLRCTRRKLGCDCWEFLWREIDEGGNKIRRTSIIGTLEQYPDREAALAAVNGLRVGINDDLHRKGIKSILVTDLIDHYIESELSPEASWHSVATRKINRYFLQKWIRPPWGSTPIRAVRTLSVETWLRSLTTDKGEPLADATKAKIRNIFCVVFNHAIRCEWL